MPEPVPLSENASTPRVARMKRARSPRWALSTSTSACVSIALSEATTTALKAVLSEDQKDAGLAWSCAASMWRKSRPSMKPAALSPALPERWPSGGAPRDSTQRNGSGLPART